MTFGSRCELGEHEPEGVGGKDVLSTADTSKDQPTAVRECSTAKVGGTAEDRFVGVG